MTRYEIRQCNHAPCELWSIVVKDTWYAKDHEFKNYVCEGTYTYCNSVKAQLAEQAEALEDE